MDGGQVMPFFSLFPPFWWTLCEEAGDEIKKNDGQCVPGPCVDSE